MTTILTKLVARTLLIPSILIALAIMFKGYSDVGDGFSAGVIAGLGVLLQAVAFGVDELDRLPLVRYAPAGTFVGLLLALGTVFAPWVGGKPLFTHSPGVGEHVTHFGTLEFITPVLFDVGVFLVIFGFVVGIIGAIGRAQTRVLRDRRRHDDARARQRAAAQQAGGGQ
jgi:multisubunit Na+/H+ antiporter MnhB subunit